MKKEEKKQNRLYLSDEQKKRPLSFSATEQEEFFIRRLAYINGNMSISKMIIALCMDKSFRKKFKDIPQSEIEKELLK